jgi:hypothetical protein
MRSTGLDLAPRYFLAISLGKSAACHQPFKKDPDGYYRLCPVLRNILELSEYVRTSGSEAVNAAGASAAAQARLSGAQK